MKFDLFQRKLLNEPYSGKPCESGYVKNGGRASGLADLEFADTNSVEQRYTNELYLKKMVELCEENQAKVYFHYLPTFGLIDYQPHQTYFYESYGEIFYPSDSLLDINYWSDASHLNTLGANIVTRQLVREYSF